MFGQNLQLRKNNMLVLCINTIELIQAKKQKKDKNRSNSTNFNCQKKGHFASNYSKFSKAKN